MSGVTTEISTQDNKGVLKVSGQLDTQSCVNVEKALVDLIEQTNGNVEVDLSELDYINSPGVGVFFDAHRRATEKGGTIVLSKPTERVKEIFDLLGLGAVMSIQE